MPNEKLELECPGCGAPVKINTMEFVDVQENPELKSQIIEGEFFLTQCEECGDLLLVEYPLTYVDADRKLTVYMEPEHDEEVLENLNSLDIPVTDEDADKNFRLVYNGVQLMEKILIAEKGRDDRVIELYKFLIWDQVKEEWPDLEPGDLLYMFDDEEEYLVIWTSDNGDDEKLTITLDDEMYDGIEEDYMQYMQIEPGEYAEVDQDWISERFTR